MVRAADRAKRPARTSVWLEGKAPRGGGARGGQPSSLDRDRITEVTVRLLDAEGLAKFSMRRLAAELNVTAMSVYWYVDTKDDLLELALDAVFGELELPDPESGEDWREQLRALAVGYRGLLVRHPWVSPLVGTFLNIGPHSMAFSLRVQEVVRNTGLSLRRQSGAISAVFQWVYGFGTIEGHFVQRCASAGMTQDEYFHQAMSTFSGHPQFAENYESAAGLMEARGGDTVEEMRERDFSVAFELLVAGIESVVAGEALREAGG
ncbi:TetR/AcrR family transcriptional regulator [Streptomyces phaeochromogenes]|uniref:TetR/AcrR family transcriptional regulator n=1 Tax=Streptomyces phaeochromogenes TaxID=1923 RepID=UPI0033D1D468|nr:TetR/AcrR family transcriptional regulator [Streptomyces phaeochromogenes]WSW16229.1 TetR/AcrR family transcriptional regulator [Streptomyces phaeochromogenes]WTA05334.1 TetR/AcrR family transcriptional regulator [Streptomyces phaeochromogenes]